jgi:molybdopterin-binding protein
MEAEIMKLSARNQLRGTVTDIREGIVEAQVTIDIGGGQTVVSVITVDSVKNLGIQVGSKVVAIVKADNVMVGVE